MKKTENRQSGVIRDGYTRPGYVEPQKWQYDAVEFTYRVILAEERQERRAARDEAMRDAPRRAAQLDAQVIEDKMVEWSLDVELKRDVILKTVDPDLVALVGGILIGLYRTDENPNWVDPTHTDKASQFLNTVPNAPEQNLGNS